MSVNAQALAEELADLRAQLAAAQAKLDAPSPHCHETEWHERIAAHQAKLEAALAEAARHVEAMWEAHNGGRGWSRAEAAFADAKAWLESRGGGR